MSIRTGLTTLKVSVCNKLAQPTGDYAGNGNIITTLNKGTYLIVMNVGFLPLNGGQITNSQIGVTSNFPWGNGAETIITANSLTGPQGLAPANEMRWSISNIFVNTADNVPLYVYLTCSCTTGWYTDSVKENANFDYLCITQLS